MAINPRLTSLITPTLVPVRFVTLDRTRVFDFTFRTTFRAEEFVGRAAGETLRRLLAQRPLVSTALARRNDDEMVGLDGERPRRLSSSRSSVLAWDCESSKPCDSIRNTHKDRKLQQCPSSVEQSDKHGSKRETQPALPTARFTDTVPVRWYLDVAVSRLNVAALSSLLAESVLQAAPQLLTLRQRRG